MFEESMIRVTSDNIRHRTICFITSFLWSRVKLEHKVCPVYYFYTTQKSWDLSFLPRRTTSFALILPMPAKASWQLEMHTLNFKPTEERIFKKANYAVSVQWHIRIVRKCLLLFRIAAMLKLRALCHVLTTTSNWDCRFNVPSKVT